MRTDEDTIGDGGKNTSWLGTTYDKYSRFSRVLCIILMRVVGPIAKVGIDLLSAIRERSWRVERSLGRSVRGGRGGAAGSLARRGAAGIRLAHASVGTGQSSEHPVMGVCSKCLTAPTASSLSGARVNSASPNAAALPIARIVLQS